MAARAAIAPLRSALSRLAVCGLPPNHDGLHAWDRARASQTYALVAVAPPPSVPEKQEAERKRVEAARKTLLGRVADVLDERDLDDFDRVSKKLLAAFERESS